MSELHFEQGPIRPPSEAYSLLLRVTRNCPWNRCEFCHIYKGKMLALIDRSLALSAEEKTNFRLGGSAGVDRSLDDLSNPELRHQVEKALRRIELERPGEIEKVLSDLMESFI